MTFLVWVSSSISVSLGRRLQKRPAVCHVVPAIQLKHFFFDLSGMVVNKFKSVIFYNRFPAADREAVGNAMYLNYESPMQKEILGVWIARCSDLDIHAITSVLKSLCTTLERQNGNEARSGRENFFFYNKICNLNSNC